MDTGLLQRNEFEALTAIYGDDFEKLNGTGKSQQGTHIYRLRIHPDVDDLKGHVSVFLILRIPKKYPYVSLGISTKKDVGLSDSQLSELEAMLKVKSIEFGGYFSI